MEQASVKRCSNCKVEKILADFHYCRSQKYGRCAACKECEKKRHAERRKADPEGIREKARLLARKRAKDPELLARKNKKARERSRVKNYFANRDKNKTRARVKLNQAVASGKIAREPCEECGRLDSQGHHDDYAKPLDVRWLCSSCHADLHRKMR